MPPKKKNNIMSNRGFIGRQLKKERMVMDYREKIRKLLKLGGSDNENESRDALLKAKELMAEHKLTESDLDDYSSKKVQEKLTDVTFSKRRDPWIYNLAGVIASNYCCQSLLRKEYGKQTIISSFIGREDDLDICITIFKYAVECIHVQQKELRKDLIWFDKQYRKSVLTGYGSGYVNGISRAFKEQKRQRNKEWGLVMCIPTDVKEACRNYEKLAFQSETLRNQSWDAYEKGTQDGMQFNPEARIGEI